MIGKLLDVRLQKDLGKHIETSPADEIREASRKIAAGQVTRDARERRLRHHQHRVNFEIWVDGQVRLQSGLMSSTDPPRYLVVEGLASAKEIKLVTRLDSDGDDPTFLATWADAQFYKAGNGNK